MPRVFLPGAVEQGELVALPDAAAHHLGGVLRLQPGRPVLGIAPDGSAWDLLWAGAGRVRVLAPADGPSPEPDVAVTLACAVPRGERMDWLVEKAVELGAAALLPLKADRSPAGGQVGAGRAARWERLAQAAAEQAGRRRVPPILPAADLASAVEGFAGARLLAHPGGEPAPLRELLARPRTPPAGVLLAVGPEGGWTPREVAAARAAGAGLLSLGPRILRVETAALAGLTLVLAACGGLGRPAER